MTDQTRPTRPDLSCDDVRDLAASFVLGALDADDAYAVRAHLASCADPHAEIAELGSVLTVVAESVPLVEPPAGLKDRILAAAAADLDARKTVAAPTTPTPAPTPFRTTAEPQRRAAGRPRIGDWALRVAAVLAFVLLGGWNLLLQNQLGEARTYEQSVAAVLDTAGKPGSLTAVLSPTSGEGPVGLAAVASDGTVRIAMRNLPATSGSQVYETWVIGSDGVPQAIGSFQVGPTGIAYFEKAGVSTQPGSVLALTLEPGPGATKPTTDPVSVGKAVAAG